MKLKFKPKSQKIVNWIKNQPKKVINRVLESAFFTASQVEDSRAATAITLHELLDGTSLPTDTYRWLFRRKDPLQTVIKALNILRFIEENFPDKEEVEDVSLPDVEEIASSPRLVVNETDYGSDFEAKTYHDTTLEPAIP